jgi:CubicO group peptidase (beta-lactamase class C family)
VLQLLLLATFLVALVAPSSAGVAAASVVRPVSTRGAIGDDDVLRRVDPASVGMSSERLAVIDRVVGNAIDAGGFPGAAVIVGRHGGIVWERGYGTVGRGSRAAVNPERTLYDLASLTKVVATSAAAMVLVDQGRLGLDDPVARYLPEFRDGVKSQVTIRQLLTHTSGLPVGRDLPRGSRTRARRVVLRTPLVTLPDERSAYSDVGVDVLGFVIERVTRMPLDKFARRAIYTPLGMRNTTFRPSSENASRIAPTENGVPRGVVHDRNARALGGVAGHAGLFATAADLAIFAQFMLERGSYHGKRLVRDNTVALFTTRWTGAGRQALGWETCAGGGSCGQYLGPTAFGHTGFTGTSIWVDPDRDLFVIVLTNWLANGARGGVAPVAVHDVRSDIADVAALAVMDGEPRAMPERMRSDIRIGW